MKSSIYRFLIACAGSDEAILNRCPRSEHIKHAGFGALVLVPATLGLFSMTYAISTFVKNPWIYLAAGVTWAVIVFVFDRFLISSFRKRGNVLKDVTSLTFISRLVFSAFVGVAVAHPLVLLYFHESIEVNMAEVAHAKVDSIEHAYESKRQALILQNDTLGNSLIPLMDTIHLQEGILHDEIKGVVRNDDRTTGRAGEGPTFKYDTAYLNRLYTQLAIDKAAVDLRKEANGKEMKALDSTKGAKIARLTFATDYLEREKALSRLSDANPVIRITTLFLIFFFILVDILPVTWKGLTSKGPYDEYLNETETLVRNVTAMRILDSDTDLEKHKLSKTKELETHRDDLGYSSSGSLYPEYESSHQ